MTDPGAAVAVRQGGGTMALKITVLKRLCYPELAGGFDVPVERCRFFEEGQEFVFERLSTLDNPANFCKWAWTDLYLHIWYFTHFEGGPQHETSGIACCTHGFSPVVFRLERT